LRIHKGRARNSRNRPGDALVREVDTVDVTRAEDPSVDYHRISNVDVGDEPAAAAKSREKWLAEAQRKPSDRRAKSEAEEEI